MLYSAYPLCLGRLLNLCDFIYLFLAMLGLRCCAGFSLSTQASHCSGFSCYRARALEHAGSEVVAPRLWSTGSVA